jgi:hypothetical protein
MGRAKKGAATFSGVELLRPVMRVRERRSQERDCPPDERKKIGRDLVTACDDTACEMGSRGEQRDEYGALGLRTARVGERTVSSMRVGAALAIAPRTSEQ